MNDAMPHRMAPCVECPWRLDAEPGKFPPERFEALRATSVQPEGTGHLLRALAEGQEQFGCHQGAPGTGEDLACAGWLAVAGLENMSVRIALMEGRLPDTAVRPGPGWPALYASYDEMAEANGCGTPVCEHPAHRRQLKFGGAVVCQDCALVVDYWKPPQPHVTMTGRPSGGETCSPS